MATAKGEGRRRGARAATAALGAALLCGCAVRHLVVDQGGDVYASDPGVELVGSSARREDHLPAGAVGDTAAPRPLNGRDRARLGDHEA
jgi:hypothetical protein